MSMTGWTCGGILSVAALLAGGCGREQARERHRTEEQLLPETPPSPHRVLQYSALTSLYGPAGIREGQTTRQSIQGWFGEPAYRSHTEGGDVWTYYIWKGEEAEAKYGQLYGKITPYYQVDIRFSDDVVRDFSVVDLVTR